VSPEPVTAQDTNTLLFTSKTSQSCWSHNPFKIISQQKFIQHTKATCQEDTTKSSKVHLGIVALSTENAKWSRLIFCIH